MTKRQAEKLVSFTSWAMDHPNDPVPGDRLDLQFDNLRLAIEELSLALDRLLRADGKLNSEILPFPLPTSKRSSKTSVQSPPLEGPQALGPNAGGFYASDVLGATATSADYAQVSIEWAEHMPDTIPANTLAINAVTGDHWSSRWWANRVAVLLQSVFASGSAPTATPIAEPVAVTAPNTLALLSNAPVDALTTMEVVVNGRAFCGCATPAPFTVVGKQITWASTLYSINPGDEVVARYRFSVTASSSPPAVAGFPAISLYYLAVQGQKDFLLSTPDRFTLTYNLRSTSRVEVSRNGMRLMPDDGTGKGGYIVSTNSISLLWPAGSDETIIIDVWEQASTAEMTPQLIVTERLIVGSPNVVPPLGRSPDGQVTTLFFLGEAFFPPDDFSVAGNVITWLNPLYALPVGAEIEVTYSYANVAPPAPSSFSRILYVGAPHGSAVPNSSAAAATNTSVILSLLAQLSAIGGGELVIDDVYYVNPISYVFVGNVTVTFLSGAKLIGAAGFTTPLLEIDSPGRDGTQTGVLVINNPNIDCSAGNDAAGFQSSAIHASYWASFTVNNPYLYGGTTYNNTNADSGVEAVDCLSGGVFGGTIQGFCDCGIYNSGDNTLTNNYQGAVFSAVGVTFLHCNVGFISKRAFNNAKSVGCSYIYCKTGCGTVAVGPGQQPLPGRRFDATGNFFQFIANYAAVYSGGSTGLFEGNVVEDYGYAEDGVTPAVGQVCGMFANGAANLNIKGNTFRLRQWTNNATQLGILSASATVNGTLYTGGGHSCSGNTYIGIVTGASETASGGAINPSNYLGEFVSGLSLSGGLNYHLIGTSVAEYYSIGSTVRYRLVNSIITTGAYLAFHQKQTGALFASLGAAFTPGSNGISTITVTGALSGDTVVVTPINAVATDARTVMIARAVTDHVDVNFINNSPITRDMTTSTYAVEVWRYDNT